MKYIEKISGNQAFIRTITILAILIFLNIASRFYYYRFDLTKDKRHTISRFSKEMMQNLDDVIFIRVFLDGDLPAGFRKLREAAREMITEFKAYGGKRVEFEFIDPLKSKSPREQEEIINQFMEAGMEPVNLEVKTTDQVSQKIIFPSAYITYKDRSIAVSLLKQQLGLDPQEVLHNSAMNLEFQFVNSIKKLLHAKRKNVAFISGHGELDSKQLTDIQNTLSEYCNVKTIDLPKFKAFDATTQKWILGDEDLIIIAKPDTFFEEADKYKIDQYLMRGGRILWFVESLLAEIDSLGEKGFNTTIDYPLNLEDMLLTYGIKLQYDLVQDLQCHLIPIMTTMGTPKQDFRPWVFYPLVEPGNSHPITNNLNAIWFRFASSIDTISRDGVKKTILLQSSEKSRSIYNPAVYSLKILNLKTDERIYNSGPKTLAVLLEGNFRSVFKNRLSPATLASGNYGSPLFESKPAKMIFVSDGDVIACQVSKIRDQIYPLGYDRFTNQTFGNKDFVLNCIDYLLDDSGIMALRSKNYKLRLLDKTRAKGTKTEWQLLNLVAPIALLLLFGGLFNYFRKRKYAR